MNIIRNIFNVKLISIIAMAAFLFATTATTYAFRPFFPFPTDPGQACTLEELFAPSCDPLDEECLLRLINHICAVYDTWRLTEGEGASLAGAGTPCEPTSPSPLPLFDPSFCSLINAFGGLDSLCDGARFGPASYPFP